MRKFMFSLAGLLVTVNLFSQNVGIGTTTPETILHIAQTNTVTDGSDGVFVNIQNTNILSSTGTLTGIRFRMDGVGTPTNSRYKGAILFQKTGLFGVGNILFATNAVGDNSSITAADAKMTITSSGNIGIGTAAPAVKLHVNTSSSEVIRIQGASPYLSLYDNTDGYAGYFWYNGTDIVLGGTSGHALRFVSNGFYKMTINTDGRVSIGSSNNPATGYLLSVDGKIICTEARVQASASWPDYVFKKNYRLLPIAEVEKQIRLHGHLPGLPAATQVEKEGFDLGDMNNRLLKKIEELTLYIIKLDKENKKLNDRVKKLEEK